MPGFARHGRWALALLAPLAVPTTGCVRPAPQHPNLILISIDTLRADHLGSYGYGRDTSPHIDRLAREGILFERVYSTSNWTLPSHASLFTGLYPAEHGVVARGRSLADGHRLLPEALTELGYRSVGVVSTVPFVRKRYGFGQGWEIFDDQSAYGRSQRWASHRASEKVHEFAVAQLDRLRNGPFFLFLHNFDVHNNYEPPAPFDTMFVSAPPPPSQRLAPGTRRPRAQRKLAQRATAPEESPQAKRERLMPLYDGEIRWVDDWIGKLVEELRRRDLLDKSVIAVVSDHGEEFYEHGNWRHGENLYDTSLRVPWIVRLPGARHAGTRIAAPVSLVDVPATLLELAGAESPQFGSGRDRSSWFANGASGVDADAEELFSFDRAAFHRATTAGGALAIIASGFKAIFRTDKMDRPLLPAVGLYRLDADPGELNDLTATEPERAAALRDRLEKATIEQLRRQRRVPPSRRNPPSAEEEEQLKALGYL